MVENDRIKLSEHFTYAKLFRFVIPSVVMMVFTSIYGMVDGFFVSNYVGTTPFAAINLIWPVIMMLSALGFMVGTGGTAIVAKTLGEGDGKKANRYFSMLVYATVIGGVALAVIVIPLLRTVSELMGAEGDMLEDCVVYGTVMLISLPFFMLQNVFQSFFVTAEKPKLGLYTTVGAGVVNIALDAVFIVGFGWGLVGAAVATGLSQFVGGVFPLIYFARENDSLLKLSKTSFYGKVLLKTCTNGSSELMSNISSSIVVILFNNQLLKMAGENGVAAYGVLMYASFTFAAIFIGYSIGGSPVVSYHYGAGNTAELKSLFRKSMIIVGSCGVAMLASGQLLAAPLSAMFTDGNEELYQMTLRGFRIFAFSFVMSGFNIFGSAFFTALNNGVVSAVISFLRTFVFQIAGVLILPVLLGLDGIWSSLVAAELLSLAVTIAFLVIKRKKYHYA